MATREQNERKFTHWITLPDGGRRYWFDVIGRRGRRARYVKEVDAYEQTVKFYQEIYNAQGKLIELHEKFPIDKGHQQIKQRG
jgi:hypothetical protein